MWMATVLQTSHHDERVRHTVWTGVAKVRYRVRVGYEVG